MEDFAGAFGLSAKDWSAQETGCSLGANTLWPGEEATFTFFVKASQPYKGPLTVKVIQYGTTGKPGDWWKPIVFKIAETSSSTLDAVTRRTSSNRWDAVVRGSNRTAR